ncbi:MAG TPA: penicillin-binding protein 2 [Anaerolineales bacterium]|nr:penicillin-binding protein 2 [Anaerolineales bacterium]
MTTNSTLDNTLHPRRITAFFALIGVVFVVFIIRLFGLQILQQADWLAQATDQRIIELSLPTLRGTISDRNGTVLARNIPSYNIIVTPANLPEDPADVDDVLRRLADLIDVPLSRSEVTPENPYVPCVSDHGIQEIVEFGNTTAPFRPVRVLCAVDREIALVIQEKAVDLPGVEVEIEAIREYPTGSLTAATVGFLGPIPEALEAEMRELGFDPNRDKIGYAGAELAFNSLLAGLAGQRTVEVDVAGQVLRDVLPTEPPVTGNNLVLTLDTRLQQAAEAILVGEIDYWNTWFNSIRSNNGVVIAINPQTGEILAMVSYPTYENNRMARLIPGYYYEQLANDPLNPLLNHAVGAELPAGSVFKLVTAVGALNEEVVTPEQIIKTPPEITVDERFFAQDIGTTRRFVDWKDGGFGQLDFIHGLANSSNVYFYKLGGGYAEEVPEGLGICRIGAYARALGYGNLPGIELPDTEDGLIPDPTWKRLNQGENWSTGDTYIAGVGQGLVLATPLQVLLSAATIANDGELMRPTILREVVDDDGNVVQPFEPETVWDITQDPVIASYTDPASPGGCESKLIRYDKPIKAVNQSVEPWVIDKVQEGMRLAVLEGTLSAVFSDLAIPAAGKTGTAEYCDDVANDANKCIPGNWPTHSWSVAYAPFDNPEIAVVAFVYNGGEGASVAGPIVRDVIEAYFELRTIDTTQGVQ